MSSFSLRPAKAKSSTKTVGTQTDPMQFEEILTTQTNTLEHITLMMNHIMIEMQHSRERDAVVNSKLQGLEAAPSTLVQVPVEVSPTVPTIPTIPTVRPQCAAQIHTKNKARRCITLAEKQYRVSFDSKVFRLCGKHWRKVKKESAPKGYVVKLQDEKDELDELDETPEMDELVVYEGDKNTIVVPWYAIAVDA